LERRQEHSFKYPGRIFRVINTFTKSKITLGQYKKLFANYLQHLIKSIRLQGHIHKTIAQYALPN
jgi:hypothetical protein